MGDVKMNFKEMGHKGVGYIHLDRNGDKRRAFVGPMITSEFYKILGISLPAAELLAFQ